MTDQEKRRAGINRSIAPLTPEEETRFWKYVDKSEEHWLWIGARVYGYGKFKLRGLSERAHRVSFAIANGGCPSDKDVLHKCDIPGCIRPDHLFLGRDLENAKDRVSKGRQGDTSGIKNGHSRLTEEQVMSIFFDTRTQRTIAADYGLRQSSVSFIKHGQQWNRVTAQHKNGKGEIKCNTQQRKS